MATLTAQRFRRPPGEGKIMQCRTCGEAVPLGAALCPNCGATQPKTERPDAPEPPPAAIGASASQFVAAPIARPAVRPPIKRPAYDPPPTYYTAPERAAGMVALVLALLLLGSVFAYSLPAVSNSFGGKASLREVERYFPRAWLVWLAHLGIVAAAIAALAYDTSNRRAQAWWITLGCLLMIPFWISLVSYIAKFNSGIHVASGIWLATICFGIAAIVPWIALKRAE